MKNHIFVRPVRPEDRELFVKWSCETKNNLFDPDVIRYPTTFVFCAFDGDGPIAYCPVQSPLMMEALAVRPGAPPEKVALALKELTQAVVTQAHVKGSGEVYFLCRDEETISLAKRQAFEELPWRAFRIKLSDLEKPKPNESHV